MIVRDGEEKCFSRAKDKAERLCHLNFILS
jgi:hypothetical protein